MNLFVFGLGYSASHFVRPKPPGVDRISGTVRTVEKVDAFRREGIAAFRFDGVEADPAIADELMRCQALLVSVQPGPDSDPVLTRYARVIEAAPVLRTIVYLSTIGVYGDHGGAWIDETAAVDPANARQGARVAAERDWLALGKRVGAQAVVLRLAGIYGPGRNALRDLRNGEARRVVKPGQVFNRIHVADIGHAIGAALRYRGAATVFNVTDDEPAPAPDVVAYAADLMGVAPPPEIAFDAATLSPMGRSFYAANRRVRNTALKTELGATLAYPTYRAGLDSLWAGGEGRA